MGPRRRVRQQSCLREVHLNKSGVGACSRARPVLRLPGRDVAVGPIDLLVLQSTPFCNINCRYCYLPDRANRHRLAPETLKRLFERIVEAPWLIGDELRLSWHAGEPLTLPCGYYSDAFAEIDTAVGDSSTVSHSFQTNGTLINREWVEFIRHHRVRIGLSLDGPAFLHDENRRTRTGGGTHAKVMRGASLLAEAQILFSVIAVVTRQTLAHADDFYDFFRDHGISRVALNVEEVELFHDRSSLGRETAQQYQRFLERLFQRSLEEGQVDFRELAVVRNAVAAGAQDGRRSGQLIRPFATTTCDHAGNIFTFSPELAGASSIAYGDFIVGNVHRQGFDEMLSSPAMMLMLRDIHSGIDRCAASCGHFSLCLGGTPGNKFFENGSFDSTETAYCLHSRQGVANAALAVLERAVFGQSANAPQAR